MAHCLLDEVIARWRLRNDAELSRLLRLAPSSISKIRHRHAPLTAEVMLRIHEAFDIPIAELKRLQARQHLLDHAAPLDAREYR
ncbi:transcriptional regulator [Duganella sp. FT94W]|uniref:Transcriptional regulator n=1 Tax=Duganella lactea TaxID=2692173 RepID=A0ABW9V773_9BURK|nr:transcriptional regulator [Duganella lactea]